MFGQPASTPFGSQPAAGGTTFGGGTTTAFGGGTPAPAPAFGGGGFGAPAPAPSTGFGGGGSGFGAPAQASPFGGGGAATGGGFGTPAPAAPAAGFGSGGGGGGFGQSAGTSTFGGASTSTPFGAPAPAPAAGGGLFGSSPAPAPAGGGLFGGGGTNTNTATSPFGGGANTTNTFGGAQTGGFGATAAAPAPAFGAPAAPAFGAASTTSTFGAPAPAPSTGLFGAPSPAPAFGAAPAAPAPGLFGAPAAGAAGGAGGTKVAPYQVTNRTDGASSISLHSITAMQPYEQKSFEELRFEDYSAGNKGSGSGAAGGAATGGFGGFGATTTPAPAPGGFGGFGASTTPAPAPGGFGGFGSPAPAPATGGFGAATAPAPAAGGFSFGAPAPAAGGFGSPAPAPAGGGLFGAPAPAPAGGGLFGAPAPAPAGGGLFGAPAPAPAGGGLFGAPAPAPASGGLFGAPAPAPAGGGLFGAPAPAPAAGGLFGSPAPAPAGGGLFGAPAPAPAAGGLFGAPAPAPAGGGLFGAPAPAPAGGGLFGAAAPAPAFGAPAPAPGGGLFGAPAPAPAGGGLFGAPAPAPAGGGLFGAAAPAPAAGGGLFGAAPAAPATVGVPAGASVIPPTADAVLAQKLAAVENQMKEAEKLEVWRGKSPQTSSIIPQSLPERDAQLSSYAASSMGLSPYRASPRSSAQIRPRGFSKAQSPTPALKTLGNGGSQMMSPDAYVGSSVKRLVIKPESLAPKPRLRLQLTDTAAVTTAVTNGHATEEPKQLAAGTPSIQTTGATDSSSPSKESTEATPALAPTPRDELGASSGMPQNGPKTDAKSPSPSPREARTPTNGSGYAFYQQVVGKSPAETPQASRTEETKSTNFVPILTNPGYVVTPSIAAMSKCSEADLAAVEGFRIERAGFGSVAWDGSVDVRGVNLDEVVCIENKDVAVYDNMEADGRKPAVGSKLNRPAVITIENIFSKQGSNADDDAKMKRKLEKTCKKQGTDFISYVNGEWKFRVHHFSRYGFDDSDSDDEEEMAVEEQAIEQSHFELGERGGRSPSAKFDSSRVAMTRTHFSGPDDESMASEKTEDDVALVSDGEQNDQTHESKVLDAAEAAYALISEMAEPMTTNEDDFGVEPEEEEEDFSDEGISSSCYSVTKEAIFAEEPLPPRPKFGICAKIAEKCGVGSGTSSGTDFGLRMGRSFRVGFMPDGSFLHLHTGSQNIIVKSRPLFRSEENSNDETSTLETHLQHSTENEDSAAEGPNFSLPKSQDHITGTDSSYTSLCNAMNDYTNSIKCNDSASGDIEEELILKRAFSLLMCLYGQEADKNNCLSGEGDERRIAAFSKWLKETCKYDVQQVIERAKGINDVYGSIFAALTGGDLVLASSIALESGHYQLSALLSAGMMGRDDLREQVQKWYESGAADQMSSGLLRIYSLLGGNLELEENMFRGSGESVPKKSLDWRRQLTIRQFFDDNNTEKSVSDLVRYYDNGISSGVVPCPYPRYVKSESQVESHDLQCLLYRILRVRGGFGGDGTKSVAAIVQPAGYTSYIHDFSGSFHLAATLSAIGCCQPLTSYQEASLIYGYAAQLINSGRWEWAVYIFLCYFDSISPRELLWRQDQAKNIIIQHYTDSDSSSYTQRLFLENEVGIPSEWFEEALAIRCISKGEVHSYVNHLAAFEPDEARIAFEELLLPNLLFTGFRESLKLLEVFGTDGLSAAVLDFFQLSEEVLRLSQAERTESAKSVPHLLEKARNVHSTLTSYKGVIDMTPRMYPGFKAVPRSAFLAEALAGLSFLHLQLKALEAGVSIIDKQRVHEKGAVILKVASQLAYLSSSDKPEDELPAPKLTKLAGLV